MENGFTHENKICSSVSQVLIRLCMCMQWGIKGLSPWKGAAGKRAVQPVRKGVIEEATLHLSWYNSAFQKRGKQE